MFGTYFANIWTVKYWGLLCISRVSSALLLAYSSLLVNSRDCTVQWRWYLTINFIKDNNKRIQIMTHTTNWLYNQFGLDYIHWLAKTWIYLTPKICIKRIFDSRPFMYNKIFLKITLIEVGSSVSSHLYASFGTFYTQIGQLFKAQWVFIVCLKFDE